MRSVSGWVTVAAGLGALAFLVGGNPRVARADPKQGCECPPFTGLAGETQLDMNRSAASHRDAMNHRLDAVLQAIEANAPGDAELAEHLKASQQTWTRYREAQLALRWPGEDSERRVRWGSVYLMGWALEDARLTHRRIHDLLPWLHGVEEGEVGAGTIPVTPR